MSTGVAMIALDAADLGLLRRWAADGTMPTVASVLERAAFSTLSTPSRLLAGSVWPTFFTATPPTEHGFHHYLQWSPERMALQRPDPEMPGAQPFWRTLAAAGARVVALDIPFTPAVRPGGARELVGWSTIDSLVAPQSSPAGLLEGIAARHGPPPRIVEDYALTSLEAALALRDQQVDVSGVLAEVAEGLLRGQDTDLFLCALPGLHRAGHRLWDATGLRETPRGADARAFDDALRQVYAASDRALARMLEAADARDVILFSVHGMGSNTSRVEILDDMLARVLAGGPVPPNRAGLTSRLRMAVPEGLRHAVKSRLPTGVQDRITGYWRTGGRDWSGVRALSLVADLAGYLRINAAGREAQGAVPPGEVPALMAEIAEGLASFVDADTGAPVVRGVVRPAEVLGPGAREDVLPDLVVDWAPGAAAAHRAVVSPRYGEIPWPTPGRHPSGRSGNHTDQGFHAATGPGLSPACGRDGDIMDLAPTVLSRLGAPVPGSMRGAPLLPGPAEGGA